MSEKLKTSVHVHDGYMGDSEEVTATSEGLEFEGLWVSGTIEWDWIRAAYAELFGRDL